MHWMTEFNAGAIALGYAVIGVFFLRFWRRTRDGLFAAFAGAFWLMAANSFLVEFLELPREHVGWVYLLRLAAFALIIFAIVNKSVGGAKAR